MEQITPQKGERPMTTATAPVESSPIPKLPLNPRDLCGKTTLLGNKIVGSEVHYFAIPLECGRWDCPKCAPKLAKKWFKKMDAIEVDFHVTYNTEYSKEHQRSWATAIQKLRRRGYTIEYLRITNNSLHYFLQTDIPTTTLLQELPEGFEIAHYTFDDFQSIFISSIKHLCDENHVVDSRYGFSHTIQSIRSSRGFDMNKLPVASKQDNGWEWGHISIPVESLAKGWQSSGHFRLIKRVKNAYYGIAVW